MARIGDAQFALPPRVPRLARDMTLRDYFAAKVLHGLVSSAQHARKDITDQDFAVVAYAMADVMLEERDKDDRQHSV